MAKLRWLLVILCVSCLGDPNDPTLVGDGMPILFIGNSHTYTNDVPGILQALADSAGKDIAVASVTGPDLALIDHWMFGEAAQTIRSRQWQFVVMQQGWTPAGVCQDTLRLAARNFATAIRISGGTPALFQIWPPSNRPGQWQGTIESYRLAAKDVSGLLFPVAEVWREVALRDPSVDLYLDGLHANGAGSYLAALVMYTRLFNESPVGLPMRLQTRSGVVISVPAALAQLLQNAAADIALKPTPDEPPGAVPVITSTC